MTLLLELALLFIVIFFAVRIATTGHADSERLSEPPRHEIVYQAEPVS